MIVYRWDIIVNGRTEVVEWDSVTKSLTAPTVVSLIASRLVDDEETVYATPVGPRMKADLEDHLAAWATISEAIYLSGYELVGGTPAPIEPEMNMEGDPTLE